VLWGVLSVLVESWETFRGALVMRRKPMTSGPTPAASSRHDRPEPQNQPEPMPQPAEQACTAISRKIEASTYTALV